MIHFSALSDVASLIESKELSPVEGLSLTIQFMGKHLSEAILCRIGHAYEKMSE